MTTKPTSMAGDHIDQPFMPIEVMWEDGTVISCCCQIDSSVLKNVKAFLAKLDSAGIHIHKAYVFGSWVKGTPDKWSDVDVAVVSPQISDDRFEERIRLTKLAITIDDRIEPLPFSVANFSEKDPLVRMIIHDGIAVER